MTGRQVIERLLEHQRASSQSPIYMHFSNCSEYKKTFEKYRETTGQENAKTSKKPLTPFRIKRNFYLSNFTFLKKNFRSYYERREAEAFFIRTQRPDLNGQNEHKFFTLF